MYVPRSSRKSNNAERIEGVMKRLFAILLAVSCLFIGSAISESDTFTFLGRITWNSTIQEIDDTMSDLGIQRHSAYSFWQKMEFTEGKNDQYLPYKEHNIMGGSGNMIGFTTGANRTGLERISIEYEPSAIGFMNVYTQLCNRYGSSYRYGMFTYETGPNMSAYVWETADAYIILYVSDFDGTGLFSRAEKGLCKFGVYFYHSELPQYLVFCD